MVRLAPVRALARLALLAALAPAVHAESRGELLYTTHCIACHTAQAHWRDNKRATDWTGLKAEVRRWQAQALLRWSDEDVVEVARYLNERYYRFPVSAETLGQASGSGAPAAPR